LRLFYVLPLAVTWHTNRNFKNKRTRKSSGARRNTVKKTKVQMMLHGLVRKLWLLGKVDLTLQTT